MKSYQVIGLLHPTLLKIYYSAISSCVKTFRINCICLDIRFLAMN